MKTKRGILGVAAAAVCICLAWYGASIQGRDTRTRYRVRPEIRPEIRLPEYRTDAARAIDAYERLMDRFIELSRSDLGEVSVELEGLNKGLQGIDAKLAGISQRLARIEKALGIEPVPAESLHKSPAESQDKAGSADLPAGSGPDGKADRTESYSL